MRLPLVLTLLLAIIPCYGEPPALTLPRPLPNGCMLHALLYIAGLDPAVGTAELAKVMGGGGTPHAIAIITTPEGTRFGRDQELGVFPLRDESPQRAFDRAKLDAIQRHGFRGGMSVVGAAEARRSLREAVEKLSSAGFQAQVLSGAVLWRIRETVYAYSPEHGCVEIQTRSNNFARLAEAAATYWKSRR